MGILAGLRRLLGGPSRVPLLDGEVVLKRVPGGPIAGAIHDAGGELVLTDRRIFFCPDLAAQDAWVLPRAEVVDVRAGTGPSLLKAPTVVVELVDGAVREFGIVVHRLAPNISDRNVVARDAFVRAWTG